MNAANANRAASIRARLLNIAKTQGVDCNQMLVRFALERILYLMTQRHADRFLLLMQVTTTVTMLVLLPRAARARIVSPHFGHVAADRPGLRSR